MYVPLTNSPEIKAICRAAFPGWTGRMVQLRTIGRLRLSSGWQGATILEFNSSALR